MGLLCWSLFSSVESYSSLTSTTSTEGMSFFPSLFCCLAELGSVTCTATRKVCERTFYNPAIFFCLLPVLGPGTHPFPSTWFRWRCPGTVTSALLCLWRPSSTGSPSFAEAPCDCSRAPPARRGRTRPPPPLRSSRGMATLCPSPPTATARSPQSPSWPRTERSGVEGRLGAGEGKKANVPMSM